MKNNKTLQKNFFSRAKKFLSPAGFTLIELLVVVLIIGILAAIAVPQYQKAVIKSRSVEAITMLKNITDAANRYYLQNGNYYGISFDALDLDIPAVNSGNASGWNNPYVELHGPYKDLKNFRFFIDSPETPGANTTKIVAETLSVSDYNEYTLVYNLKNGYLENRYYVSGQGAETTCPIITGTRCEAGNSTEHFF